MQGQAEGFTRLEHPPSGSTISVYQRGTATRHCSPSLQGGFPPVNCQLFPPKMYLGRRCLCLVLTASESRVRW